MEGKRFDQFVQLLSSTTPRRREVMALLGGLLVALVPGPSLEATQRGAKHSRHATKREGQVRDEGKKRKHKKRKRNGNRNTNPQCLALGPYCSSNAQCCGNETLSTVCGLTQCEPSAITCCRRDAQSCSQDCDCCTVSGTRMACNGGICSPANGGSCPNSQYTAEYWNNESLSGPPSLVRCEDWPIYHHWGEGSPGPQIQAENFSARWTGRTNFSAGTYAFKAFADDRIRVYLDNELIINNWDSNHPETIVRRTVSAGVHDIKVEFREFYVFAAAEFRCDPDTICSPYGTACGPGDGAYPCCPPYTCEFGAWYYCV